MKDDKSLMWRPLDNLEAVRVTVTLLRIHEEERCMQEKRLSCVPLQHGMSVCHNVTNIHVAVCYSLIPRMGLACTSSLVPRQQKQGRPHTSLEMFIYMLCELLV